MTKQRLQSLKANNQIVFRYAGGTNPNGSVDDIAGISNEAGNVVGMMPHPERAVDQTARLRRRQTDVHIDSERLEGTTWRSKLSAKEPTAEQIAEQKIYKQFGVTDEEYELICGFLGRKPNYTEIGVFSVMWSEHCSYKNSKPVLQKFPITGPRVLMGPGEGAGIVDIGDNQAVVFKIESHNHPSAIEPYQGAATGVGGIIRDIFSMGARPVALLNSLAFRQAGKRAREIFVRACRVSGIAGYGNCIGIPTVGGEVMFDESYEGNPLVNAMCVGLIDHDKIQRGVAKGVGNPVFYVGPATGRDGIHGATFASEELTAESEAKRPAVQVGDPFMEKLVMEATLGVDQFRHRARHSRYGRSGTYLLQRGDGKQSGQRHGAVPG